MKKPTTLFALLIGVAGFLPAQQQFYDYLYNAPPVTNNSVKPGYTLIFEDEFNGPLSIGTGSNYNFQDCGPIFHFPNDMGKVTNTTRFENLRTAAGELQMITRKENPAYNVPWIWQANPSNPYATFFPNESNNGNGYEFPVTTSYIKTNKDYKYGYFEISAKLPMGPRLWPAFWLFADKPVTGGCGQNRCEIDCFEIFPTVYGKTIKLGANLHYTEETGCTFMDHSNCVHGWGDTQYCPSPEPGVHGNMSPSVLTDDDLCNSYNTYAVEWTPTEIKFYFNNVCYLTETGYVVTDQIIERMQVYLGTALQYGGEPSPWNELYSSLAPSATFSIKYLRIYKKDPTVIADPNNCRTGTMSYTATTGIPTDTYVWTFNHPNWVSGFSYPNFPNKNKISFQLYPAYQTSTIELTVTATGGASYEVSSYTFKAPDLNSDFTTGNPYCSSGGISLVATAAAVTPGSMWDIYPADQYGNITNYTSLQTGAGTTYTFNTGLLSDGYYVIKHGVWKSSGPNVCIGWSETKKLVRMKLSDFTVALPHCGKIGFSLAVTANTPTSGSSWELYPCDKYGTITNYNNPMLASGTSATFSVLVRDSYYKIKHGSWGACGAWTESWQQVYIPDLSLNADFGTDFQVGLNNTITYTATPGWNELTGFTHYWAIFNSDPAGNPTTQIGPVQWTTQAVFSGLPMNGYYMIKHGVYDDCSSWNERRYVVHNGYMNPLRTDSTNSSDNVTPINFMPDSAYLSDMMIWLAQNEPAEEVQKEIAGASIYPNPGNGLFTISTTQTADEIIIMDILGKIVLRVKPESNNVPVDISKEAEGVYLVKIISGNTESVDRIILKK